MGNAKPPIPTTPTPTTNAPHAALQALVLVAGVAGWLWLNVRVARTLSWGIAVPPVIGLLAMSLLLIRPVRAFVSQAFDRLRNPDPCKRASTGIVVTIAAGLYLAFTANVHARDLFPRIHDEHSYLLGAHMLARGRLWMPQHPLADFFESFHILVKPAYASIYFPGTAMLHAPGVWLGLPPWVMPVVISGVVVGLTYRVVAELLDGVAGLLAAMMLIGNGSFRVFSTVVMAQIPAAMLGLVMLWAWLRWRRERRLPWALAIGAAAGWAAITRPVDALAYAIPIGVATAWDLRREIPRKWAMTAAALVAAAAPFLLLQVVFNAGVTGNPLKTPYVSYLEQSQPGSAFGTRVEASPASPLSPSSTRPTSSLPQKHVYHQSLLDTERSLRGVGFVAWFAERVALMFWFTTPSSSLFVLVPAIVLTRGRTGWTTVMLAVPVLFIAAYALNPFYLGHYSLAIVPCVAGWVLVGAAALTGSRRGPAPALAVALGAICLAALPEVNPGIGDGAQAMPILSTIEQKLAAIDDPAAVVLFRFHPATSVHEEPVYNSGVAWPDDARVVRAHDLGPARNAELFAYYGAHQPQRTFYLFDRGAPSADAALVRLGPAREAAARLAEYDASR